MINKYSIQILLFTILFTITVARPPINIFLPSDRFLMPEVYPDTCYQFTTSYEGSVRSFGFQDDFKECNQIGSTCPDVKTKVNVLQLYGNTQNIIAAFKGANSDTSLGQISQLFNINGENGLQGNFIPTGCFKVPLNLMFSARYYFLYGVEFELHLPVLSMDLSDVRWRPVCDSDLEDNLSNHFIDQSKQKNCNCNRCIESNLIRVIKEVSDLDIRGWKRTGVGDLIAQMRWMADFPQCKPLISNVRTQMRLGLAFPTGLKQDEDKILAIPFGNDGSWAVQFGGGLDLTLRTFARAGVDVQFLFLFGNLRCRRIKTNCNQTDLLFLTKKLAFKDFGIGQQYNLYLETGFYGLAFKANYQYLKQNDDKIWVLDNSIDPAIVNSAESLQDWTAHSFIFSARYDYACDFPDAAIKPSLMGWFKLGFNGKRAILLDTLGLSFTLSY